MGHFWLQWNTSCYDVKYKYVLAVIAISSGWLTMFCERSRSLSNPPNPKLILKKLLTTLTCG